MILIKTKYSGAARLIAKENGVAVKELREAFKRGYARALTWWHVNARPKHFTREAYRLYGYQKRAGEKYAPHSKPWKKSYTGRKWAAGPRLIGKHHTDPLVFTGKSRMLAAIRDIRVNSRGGRAVIHARALNWRNPKSPINMRDELLTLTEKESAEMTRLFEREVDETLRGFK